MSKGRFSVSPSELKRAVLFATVAAVASSIVMVFTSISATDINPAGAGDESVLPAVNTYVLEPDIQVANSDLLVSQSNQSAAGTAPPGVEAATPTADARTALTLGNYLYSFDVLESSGSALGSGEDLRVRVWGTDNSGPTTALLATLYLRQATPTVDIEGVTVTIDLGSPTEVYDLYDILVDRQAESP